MSFIDHSMVSIFVEQHFLGWQQLYFYLDMVMFNCGIVGSTIESGCKPNYVVFCDLEVRDEKIKIG
jgi:hypothetical protein